MDNIFPSNNSFISNQGITLRDYLASEAMITLMSRFMYAANQEIDAIRISQDSYKMADAMLKAREAK